MSEISRRQALSFGVAAVAAAVVPNIPFAAPAAAAAAVPRLPVWAVGEPGEFNWEMVRALTADEAKRIWAESQVGTGCECENPADPGGDCDFCCGLASALAERKAQFDDKVEITPGDLLACGMGHICSRCGDETFREEGGRAVGKEAVCQDCMTLADWDIVDPERAAEMRIDHADDI